MWGGGGLILCSNHDDLHVMEVLQAGANGCVLMTIKMDDLIQGVHDI